MQGFGGYTEDEIAQQARAARSYAKASDEASAARTQGARDAFSNVMAVAENAPDAIGQAYRERGLPGAIGEGQRAVLAGIPALAADVGKSGLQLGNMVTENVLKPTGDAIANYGRSLFGVGGSGAPPTPSIVPAAQASTTPPAAAPNKTNPFMAGVDQGPVSFTPVPGAQPAVAAPPPTVAAPTIAGTASMGGVTKSYTQDQLTSMAGPDTQARYKGPGEIYANEMAISVAHDAYRRGELSPKDYISFLGMQANQASQLNDPAVITRNKQAALDLQTKQETEALYQQALKTRDPVEQRRLLGVLLARQGKTPQDRMIKLAGRKTKDVMGNETQEAETAIDPYTDQRYAGAGGEIGALAGKGGKGAVIPAADFQQMLKDSKSTEKDLRAYLQQLGFTVG